MAEEDKKGDDLEIGPIASKSAGEVTDITAIKAAAAVDNAGFHRRLSKRQIMMMTFGAGIGTGLWVGTGTALKYAGPGGIAVAYTLQAFIVWTLYMSIGEMTTYRPVHGGFIRQAVEYVDPALGFAEGINYWFAWVMIIPAEVTAAVSVLKFWPASQQVPLAAYITVFLVITAIPNIFPVKWYGKFEYAMSWFKLLAIFVVIFYMFIMASGGVPATGGPLVFTYWNNPGAFHNGMKGLAKAFVQAAFSFGSAQHIAMIAGEAKTPRKTIKSVVMPIFWRIFTFFILNIWLVGMCVPYDDPDLVNGSGTFGSPFVIALQLGGQAWLAHAINGFIFLTVISCGVTSVYVASRALTALSDLSVIHPAFGRKDAQGRPWVALTITTALGSGLCYLNLNSTTIEVYNWFSSLVSISTFMDWLCQLWTFLNFRRALAAQGIAPESSLPFRAPLAPYCQYLAVALTLFAMACEFYLALYPFGEEPSAKAFFSVYLAFPLFVFDYFAYKLWYKTKLVEVKDVDFSEARAFDEEDRIEAEYEAQDGTARPGRKLNVAQKAKNLVFG
ncbi:amino acid permease/ SLC12A domain-containing protein [Xylariaceae sp. FL0804]|nr:amino acid permease/ SLC12A domain-containing protein [Xylariaceae sp. FL0804]